MQTPDQSTLDHIADLVTRTPGMIHTATGKWFNLAEPTRDQFSTEDIAIGLSNNRRFSGQAVGAISVARHCIMVCDLLPKEWRFVGLIADGSEAYTGDMAKPLKNLVGEAFEKIEDNISRKLFAYFGLNESLVQEIKDPKHPVKRADLLATATEFNHYYLNPPATTQPATYTPEEDARRWLELIDYYKPNS